jgi:antitoxin VapB
MEASTRDRGCWYERLVADAPCSNASNILTRWYRLMIYVIRRCAVAQTAKLFMNGRSQAVRLPAAFRFDADEVFIRRDPVSDDVILSRRPPNWDSFFAALAGAEVPDEFLSDRDRDQGGDDRDPFAGWRE